MQIILADYISVSLVCIVSGPGRIRCIVCIVRDTNPASVFPPLGQSLRTILEGAQIDRLHFSNTFFFRIKDSALHLYFYQLFVNITFRSSTFSEHLRKNHVGDRNASTVPYACEGRRQPASDALKAVQTAEAKRQYRFRGESRTCRIRGDDAVIRITGTPAKTPIMVWSRIFSKNTVRHGIPSRPTSK